MVAVVGGAANETNVELVERWRALGIDAFLGSAAEARAALEPGDVAVGRLDVLRTLDGVEEGLIDLLELAAAGVRVVNDARALLAAHDKLRTARHLAAAGVPHVPTEHVRTRSQVTFAPPVVVKPRFGSWGADVVRCDDRDGLDRAFATLAGRPWFQRHGAIVQPLVAPMGRDLRALVAGGRVVGAESRVSGPGEWRTNISLGGSHLDASIWTEPAELAVAAARAIGGGFLGVDLLPTLDGYVVLEVNGAVEFDAGYLARGDLFAAIAEALELEPSPVAAHAEVHR